MTNFGKGPNGEPVSYESDAEHAILITALNWYGGATNLLFERCSSKAEAERIAMEFEKHYRLKCRMTVCTSIVRTGI